MIRRFFIGALIGFVTVTVIVVAALFFIAVRGTFGDSVAVIAAMAVIFPGVAHALLGGGK